MAQAVNLTKEKKGGKKAPSEVAIEFFDKHYKQVYRDEWPSLRLSLLSKPKFAAVVNNFADKEETIEELKSKGCLSIKEIYNQGTFTIQIHLLAFE